MAEGRGGLERSEDDAEGDGRFPVRSAVKWRRIDAAREGRVRDGS